MKSCNCAPVLLNLLNSLGEIEKMLGTASHLKFPLTRLINSVIRGHWCKVLCLCHLKPIVFLPANFNKKVALWRHSQRKQRWRRSHIIVLVNPTSTIRNLKFHETLSFDNVNTLEQNFVSYNNINLRWYVSSLRQARNIENYEAP